MPNVNHKVRPTSRRKADERNIRADATAKQMSQQKSPKRRCARSRPKKEAHGRDRSQVPYNDTLVSVRWMAMGPGSRSHVSGKMDASEVLYPDLEQAVMKYTSLVGAASDGGRSSIAMDVSVIASVGETEEQQPQTPTQAT